MNPKTTTAPAPTLDPLSNVDTRRGAPLGRSRVGDVPTKGVRLFKMKIDKSGYDAGGAYWGSASLNTGAMYCATDYKGYAAYIRATSRDEAAAKLKIGLTHLARR